MYNLLSNMPRHVVSFSRQKGLPHGVGRVQHGAVATNLGYSSELLSEFESGLPTPLSQQRRL